MKLYSLSQTTRYGSHTVARVKAPNKQTAQKLFREFYRKRGLPQTLPKGTCGLVIGAISLAVYEEGGLPLHTDLKTRVVTPLRPQAPHTAVHLGVVLKPYLTPPTKKSKHARPLPKRK